MIDYEVLRKDGTTGILELSASLHRDASGRSQGFSGIARDVTEKKKAERALRESEAKFRELADLLPETIYEEDVHGKLTFVNRRGFEKFGYTQEEFAKGLMAFDMIVDQDREKARANAERILAGEEIGLTEYRALRKDGTTFPAMIHSTAIVRDGKAVGVRGFIIDMTDRVEALEEKKKLEAQLQQTQKMEALGYRVLEAKGGRL